MIKGLRNRFIRIATLSVAAVMLLLTVIVNTANYISVNSDLTKTLELIDVNQGTIPPMAPSAGPQSSGETPPEKPAGDRRRGPFGPETPFSTRFFVLTYTADGTLLDAELDKIAAVTQADTAEFLAVARRHALPRHPAGAVHIAVFAVAAALTALPDGHPDVGHPGRSRPLAALRQHYRPRVQIGAVRL